MKNNYAKFLLVLGAAALFLVPETALAQSGSFFGSIQSKVDEAGTAFFKIAVSFVGLGLLLGLGGWGLGRPWGKQVTFGAIVAAALIGVARPAFTWLTGETLF